MRHRKRKWNFCRSCGARSNQARATKGDGLQPESGPWRKCRSERDLADDRGCASTAIKAAARNCAFEPERWTELSHIGRVLLQESDCPELRPKSTSRRSAVVDLKQDRA